MAEDDEDRTRPAEISAAAEEEVAEIGYGRTLALSDGVFGIAMTLLALDLRLPDLAADLTNGELAHQLRDIIPLALVYLLSFWIIAQYWVAHRRLYGMVARIDRTLTILNLVMLALVAAMPFPSSVMGEHGGLPAAVILYAGYLATTSLMVGVQWWYVGRAGLLRPAGTAGRRRIEVVNSVVTAVVLLLAAPLALVTAKAPLVWLLLLVTDRISGVHRRRGRTRAAV